MVYLNLEESIFTFIFYTEIQYFIQKYTTETIFRKEIKRFL